MADWENSCYFTFSPNYVVSQLNIFLDLCEKVSSYIAFIAQLLMNVLFRVLFTEITNLYIGLLHQGIHG